MFFAVINVLLSFFVPSLSVHVVTPLFKVLLLSVLFVSRNLAATKSSLSISCNLSYLSLISVVYPGSGHGTQISHMDVSELSLPFDI